VDEQGDIGGIGWDFLAIFVNSLTGNALDAGFGARLVEDGLRPAEAGAHLSDIVVVAHEELVVVDIVDVVGVHNATFVGAGKRETVVGGANVGATWVQGAETLLGEGTAWHTIVRRSSGDVTGTFLAGTEETGTSSLASASLGARAPGGPAGHGAVDRAGLDVARSVFLERASGGCRGGKRGYFVALLAAVHGDSFDTTVAAHEATAAGLGAGVVVSP